MALDNSVISIISENLKERLEGAFFDHPYNLSTNHFAFPYHGSNCNENNGRGTLIISVDPSNPFFTYSYDKYTKYKVDNAFINLIQKIAGYKITAVKKIKLERVVIITCVNINKENVKDIESFDLIIELFPQRPNIVLINHDTKMIVIAYKERIDAATNKYLNRNTEYNIISPRELPLKIESIDELRPFYSKQVINLIEKYKNRYSLTDMIEKINSSTTLYLTQKGILPLRYDENDKEITIEKIYSFFVEDQKKLASFLKERKLYNLINDQLKINRRKLDNLEHDLMSNTQKLIYKDYGQILFLYQTEYDGTLSILEKDGYSIPLDKDKNYVENANQYFARYRKSKNSIPILNNLIETCKNDILYLEKKLLDIENGCNRDIMELKIELEETGYLKSKNKKKINRKKKVKKKNYEPHYLIFNNFKIGYGQNDLQNETLTFSIAGIHDIFFHVKDHPGAHVVLFGESENKKNQELAAELALHLSHLDSGDVYMTKIKYVKKNRQKKGLVTFKSYQLITIKKIKDSSLKIFKENLWLSQINQCWFRLY